MIRLRVSGLRCVALATIAAALSACSSDSAVAPCPPTTPLASAAAAAVPLPHSGFDAHFRDAGARFGVDADLLKALAWTETRFHMVIPEHEDEALDHHGLPAAWGVMALRGDRLLRAATLAGIDAETVKRTPAANITAAAALLADEARTAGVAGLPAAEWGVAIMGFSGIDHPAGRTAYVYDDVLPALRRARAATGGNAIAPAAAAAYGAGSAHAAAVAGSAKCETPPPPPPPPPPPATSVTTHWRPSPNYNSRMAGVGGQISMIIVHTCEGAYTGCWSWLSNSVSNVSAHYVVNEEGTEISHLVAEEMRAWHIGAFYDCLLNRLRRCDLTNVQSNHFTVGIEHGGYASQTSFPTRQIEVSAQLACAITQRHGIPRDNQHIVAHGQLQPANRTDPGPNWPWVRYLALVQRHCGEVVVDDDGAWNDAAYARVTASAAWTPAHATAGYHGHGYRWASVTPDAEDHFVFEFREESGGARTVEARWPAGENRSAAALFTVRDAAGAVVASTTVDQRLHHDQWLPLATVTLAPGWYRVELSRAGAAGSVVVADAVRVRR
jgi:N-acetyl-anhydromuramyl-L-alanine amidase AmpD